MMQKKPSTIITGQMQMKPKYVWNSIPTSKTIEKQTQRLRNLTISAVAVFCLGTACLFAITSDSEQPVMVMNSMASDFEYDETLGRLQFVSSILPESAMTFLSAPQEDLESLLEPSSDQVTHVWSQQEPWLEYTGTGVVSACSDAEVMSVIENRQNEYTVRLLHRNGYESICSGLSSIQVQEHDTLFSGDQIGFSGGLTAFELRKDGLSIQPSFRE